MISIDKLRTTRFRAPTPNDLITLSPLCSFIGSLPFLAGFPSIRWSTVGPDPASQIRCSVTRPNPLPPVPHGGGSTGLSRSSFKRMDETKIPAEADQGSPESGWSVILASYENRHAAEHALASLRRGFRTEARKRHAKALVISGNKDGSLMVTQSRVLSATGLVYTLI